MKDVMMPSRRTLPLDGFVLAMVLLSQLLICTGGANAETQPAPDPRVKIFDDVTPHPALPQAVYDGYVGVLEDALVYAGGRYRPEDGLRMSRDVYVLTDGADTWQRVAQLPYGLSGGASLVWGSQLLIVGGMTEDGASTEILQLGAEEGEWTIRPLASLPQPIVAPSVGLIEDPQKGSRLFVAAGTEVFELDPNHTEGGWTESQSLPVAGAEVHCQLIGLDGILFAFGSAAGAPFALEYAEERWQAIALPPPGFHPEAVVRSGDAHLLFVGPSSTGQQIVTYHRLTDAWARWGDLPDSVSVDRMLSDRNGLYLFGSPRHDQNSAPIHRVVFSPSSMMHAADYAALLLYFALMVVLGVFFARRNKNTETYFEGGHNVAWLAVGMSMFATGASSISFMAMPAKAFAENWKFFIVGPLQCLILPISLFIFIPILRRERISTAYEYLERRFSSGLRLLGASFFAISQVFIRISVVMYLPAIAMEAFTGIDKFVCILIMGGLATLYTTMGGIEAVIWTDVLQGLVMIVAVILSFGAVLYQVQAPVGEMWDTAQAYHKFHMIDWGLSFQELTIWVMLVSMLFFQAVWCSDQNYVQRVQSVPTEGHARKAAISQLAIAIPLNLLFFGLGTLLFLCYRAHPDWLHVTTRNDAIFPYFVVQNLPIGLTGVIIAALFAASMSSIDSSINSSAMVLIHDFYRKFKPNTSEADTFRLAHRLSLVLGALGTGAALLIASLDRKSAWDLFIELSNLSAGSMLGIYTLGYFTRRANATGAWIGWVIGNVVLFFVWQYTGLNPWLFGPVGIGACFAGGYLASLVFKGASEVRGLTAFTISPPSPDM